MKNKNLDKVIKIILDYRAFLKNNYLVLYRNRNYFFTILNSIVNDNLNIKYIDRNEFKKRLPFMSEKDIHKIVNDYFKKIYNIDICTIPYIINSNPINISKCYIENGKKYVNICLKNNIQDCLIMAHEFRHYLNMDVNCLNPVQNYLTETLSIFEEINICEYLKKQDYCTTDDLNKILKMIYVKNNLIANENLIFFKLDQIIMENGLIDKKMKEKIYLDEIDFNKNILQFLKTYNKNGINVHTMIWYNIGTILSVLIKNNIKTGKINFEDVEILNKKLIDSSNFDILNLVGVNLNDLTKILDSYRKELENLF